MKLEWLLGLLARHTLMNGEELVAAMQGSIENNVFSTGLIQNEHPTHRLVHNLNIRFKSIGGKVIINSISKKIAIFVGSDCTTPIVEPPHVLLALGLDEEEVHSSIRIRCGRFNTEAEMIDTIDIIHSCIIFLGKIHTEKS